MTMSYRTIWGTVISSYFPLFFVAVLSLVLNLGCPSDAQNFVPDLEDKAYLNNVEKDIEDEVNKTRAVFLKQAVLLDTVARQFVAAQLKENLFIALRVLAEKELSNQERIDETVEGDEEGQTTTSETVSDISTLKPYNRTKRQDDGDEDGDDGDGAGAAAAGAAGANLRPTIPPQIGLLPQVANLVRVIFGGNGANGVNLTSYVASASKLLPRPVGNQVLGLVKILTNANANANRNSFTTANPLLAGQANLNFKAPGAGGGPLGPGALTPEQLQLIALGGLPPESLAGLTPDQLNQLAALNGFGGGGLPGGVPGGFPGAGPGDQGGVPGIPPGLTANDIAALAALGVVGLPDLNAPPATKRPRPQYSKPGNRPQQQLPPPPHQTLDPHDANLIQSQQYLNHPQYQQQNPQFIAADKDILPSNLNPNKQTISEIQQQLIQANQPVVNYQEAPQSAVGPSDSVYVAPQPQQQTQNLQSNAVHQAATAGQSGQTQSQSYLKPGLSSGFGQQLAQNQKLQLQGGQGGLVDEELDASIVGPNQQAEIGQKPHRRPLTPLQQEQALLQAQQLQIIRLQQQQNLETQKQGGVPQQQGPQIQQQSPQQFSPSQQQQQQQQFNQQQQQQQQQFNPQQQFKPNPQQQLNPQQQQQLNLQQQQQQLNLQQQQQLNLQQLNLQQQQLQNQQRPPPQQQSPQLTAQQQFQSLFQPQQRPRPPPPQQSGSTDEEESEEDDRGRQLNILGNLFPLLLGGSNNNAQQQQQQQPQPPQNPAPSVPVSPGNNQGNGTVPAMTVDPNMNMNFDLNMFATNLRRGIGDVVRVMPDLFRGAREGLQLIQALSSILRAFPGLADALPI